MSSQVHSVNPIGTDGIVRCYCNEPAPSRTSTTERNPNRDFYVCSKDRGDPKRCKFYKWKDELDRLAQPPTLSQTQVPSPSQRQRAEIARGSMTPSPTKQTHASTPQTTPSRRFADIEAALAMSKGDAEKEKQLADIETGIMSTSQSEAYAPLQTADGSDDEDVFLSAVSSSSRSTHYHIHLPETPRSPKRPRLGHGMNGNNGMLMTPPRSTGHDCRDVYMGAPPESPSIGKRKEREDEEGELSQFQRIMRDPDHSFHERAASLNNASQFPSHQASPSSSQDPVVPSSITSELVKKLMSDVTTIFPAYIAKLERKQVASEKSNEAKMRKIEELEKDITSLRNKNRVLEETVSALKARRLLS